MFYNTGIATYLWVLTNHKAPERKGKIQLVNAAECFQKMRKSLGSKRKELGAGDIDRITALYGAFEAGPSSKVFDNADFGYRTITVERPLRLNVQTSPARLARLADTREIKKLSEGERKALMDALKSLDGERVYRSRPAFLKDLKKALATHHLALSPAQTKALWQALSERDPAAEACTDAKGKPEPDPELRDTENVPLKEDIHAYFKREVQPHVPDAWIDEDKTRIGYEIPFNRHFYTYVPPRTLSAIDSDLETVSREIMALLKEITG